MKLKPVILALALALLANCNSGPDQKVIRTEEIIDNVLTLELSFGADEQILPDEYLLAKPRGILVADNGDIIVVDESRFKVFNSSGNPKLMIGRQGYGPGEFPSWFLPYITDTGFITGIIPESDGSSYNLFSPDYKFIEQKKPRYSALDKRLKEEHGLSTVLYDGVYSYSQEERLICSKARGKPEGKSEKWYYVIAYQNKEDTKVISVQEDPLNTSPSIKEDGVFLFHLLPDRKFVYTNSHINRSFKDGNWYYSLFVYDLKTHEQKEIKRAYNPVSIPDSVIYRTTEYPENLPEYFLESLKKEERTRREKLEKIKVYAPLHYIITDGTLIFAFTWEYDKKKGYIVEIIDSSTEKYLHSAYFPFIPDFLKNGYAYRLKTGSDIFPEVEKYKVNPEVYRK